MEFFLMKINNGIAKKIAIARAAAQLRVTKATKIK